MMHERHVTQDFDVIPCLCDAHDLYDFIDGFWNRPEGVVGYESPVSYDLLVQEIICVQLHYLA